MSRAEKALNPAWVKAVSALVGRSPYFTLLDMQVRELTPGNSLLRIEVGEKHLQPFGMVHGGVFASLIDAAGFWAVYPQLEPEVSATTLEMKLNYLAPAREGVMLGLGRTVKLGRSIALAEGRVEDEQGRLLAHGSVTLMLLRNLSLDGGDSLPPKFLD